MALRKRWLECACGFAGPVAYLLRPPDYCPTCQGQVYRQLRFRINGRAIVDLPLDLPTGWEHLTPTQKARVERYIATLLAEQPRLF